MNLAALWVVAVGALIGAVIYWYVTRWLDARAAAKAARPASTPAGSGGSSGMDKVRKLVAGESGYIAPPGDGFASVGETAYRGADGSTHVAY